MSDMVGVSVELLDQPSNSKGWARYRLAAGAAKVVQSRTGNEWVSVGHSGEAQDGAEMEIEMDVMLRVGKGRTARQQRSRHTVRLVARPDAVCEVDHRPGSQGVRLRITGAEVVG